MKDEFVDYARSIGLGDPLIAQVERFHRWGSELVSEEIQGIFIDDFVQEDGTRIYGGVWFFTEEYVMETGVLTTDLSFDCVPTKGRVVRWDITVSDYDFGQATTKSRMSLRVDFPWIGINGTMRATHKNCEQLTTILRKHIIPNMLGPAR